MSAVRYFNRLLTLVSEHCKYWSITPLGLCIFKCCLDSILTEALNCMTLEIGCAIMVLWVQVVANTLLTLSLAFPGCALKEMILATHIILDRNLCLKKVINSWTPVDLKMLYNQIRSEAKIILNMSLYAPSSCWSVSPSAWSSALSSQLGKDRPLSSWSSPSRKNKLRSC
jgi:hypothetical protein